MKELPLVTVATASVTATSYSWIAAATEISMLISAGVGIIVGLVAIWWNIERALVARRIRKASK